MGHLPHHRRKAPCISRRIQPMGEWRRTPKPLGTTSAFPRSPGFISLIIIVAGRGAVKPVLHDGNSIAKCYRLSPSPDSTARNRPPRRHDGHETLVDAIRSTYTRREGRCNGSAGGRLRGVASIRARALALACLVFSAAVGVPCLSAAEVPLPPPRPNRNLYGITGLIDCPPPRCSRTARYP